MSTGFDNEEVLGDLDKSSFQRGVRKKKSSLVWFQERMGGERVWTMSINMILKIFVLMGSIKIEL